MADFEYETKVMVVNEFKSGRYTVSQIAKKHSVSTATVYRWVEDDNNGILGESNRGKGFRKVTQDVVDSVIKMYGNGHGIYYIGKQFDLSPMTIRQYLIKGGVYKGSEKSDIFNGKLRQYDREQLYNDFINNDLDYQALREKYNVTNDTIRTVLKEFGITSPVGKGKGSRLNDSQKLMREQVIQYYKTGLFTHKNLSEKYGVSTRTISRILDKAGIEATPSAKYATSSRIAEIANDVKFGIANGEDMFDLAIKYNVTLDTITKIVNNDVNNPKVSKAEMKAELKAQIVKSYEENKDIKSLAQQFEVKENFVRIALKDAGVDNHNTKLSRAKESVIESFKMGKEIELIAQEHELSKPSVIKILTEAGFETRTNKTIKAKDDIIQQFNLGIDIKQIAEDNDVSLPTVIKVLKQEGLYQSSGDLTKEKVKQLYSQGLDVESIADKLGLGVAYTKNLLKEQGIDWKVKPEIKREPIIQKPPMQISNLMAMKIKEAWDAYHDIDMVVKSQGFGESYREVVIRELVKIGRIPSPETRE